MAGSNITPPSQPVETRAGSASGLNTQSEKPFHYTYLKEFRVEQCKLFLQHKCTQHRPYTCFYWHFMNQRRRRPVRRREGTFNYSPDTYCSTYDENTGLCPNGDECPYLHRNAGDTERRYHLRYYKTSTCVYETDSRGFCVKNGPHCAFAHGPHDLRSPIYDIRELTGEGEEDRLVSPLVGSLEREKGVLVDDPRWHDSSFVLTYYKTDPCKRPPRLCRQGYACPFYHNNKDRRRTPKTFKYRSTPCPDVKINDEWGDPINCDQKDQCCYCHTRTEQQFHPEIYKSTRCNDVQSTGYCPRGPYCAFAHDDKELSAPRELTEEPMTPETASSISLDDNTSVVTGPGSRPSSAVTPSHIDAPSFQRAPGAEVRSRSIGEDDSQAYLKKQLQAIDSDQSLDESEKQRRKQSLLRLSFVGPSGIRMSPDTGSGSGFQVGSLPSSISESVDVAIGQSVEDLSLDENDPLVDHQSLFNQGEEMLPHVSHSSGSGPIISQSPVAQGFLQSLQSPFVGFSSPLGSSFSPFPAPHHIQPLQTNIGLATPTSPLTSAAAAMSPSSNRGLTMAQIVQSNASGKAPGSPSRLSAPMGVGENKQQELTDELRQQTKSSLSNLHQEPWRQTKQQTPWKVESEGVGGSQTVSLLGEDVNLHQLTLLQLLRVQNQMKNDLNRISSAIRSKMSVPCTSCNEFPRSVLFQPCQHFVLCQRCSDRLQDPFQCPYCSVRISSRTTLLLSEEEREKVHVHVSHHSSSSYR